jgi:hypothetical protein
MAESARLGGVDHFGFQEHKAVRPIRQPGEVEAYNLDLGCEVRAAVGLRRDPQKAKVAARLGRVIDSVCLKYLHGCFSSIR